MAYIKSGYESEENIEYMKSLEHRLEKNPYDIQALIEKGFLYIDPFLRVEEGIALLKLAVQLNPKNVDAYFWLAKGIYHGLCDNEETKKVLKNALELDSHRADCLNLLADLVEDQEEAIALLKRAVQAQPNWPWPRIRLASYLLRNGRIEEAEQEAQETLKIFSNLTFPETKTPLEDYYELFTGRNPGSKNDIDNLFLEIKKKRKEFYGAKKSKS